jgi:hypothetical protein
VRCPLESQDNLELLLDYGTARWAGRDAAAFAQHLVTCSACSRAIAEQQVVRSMLDAWETPPVSASFTRRLYQRIEQGSGLRQRLAESLAGTLRLLLVWRGVPIAAAACLIITAGILLDQRTAVRVAPSQPPTAQVEPTAQGGMVQPDQVVHELDDMEMLGNFDRSVRAGGNSEL